MRLPLLLSTWSTVIATTFSSPVLGEAAAAADATTTNSTNNYDYYYNPVLPGWHSDPSCTQVNGTFFCVTSTFRDFPGLPIYASRDLINWKLASHVWNRESQLPPQTSWETTAVQGGHYAATLRHHKGEFYLICTYLQVLEPSDWSQNVVFGVLYRSSDPFNPDSWSDALVWDAEARIDPDLFWDVDSDTGEEILYVATAGIYLQTLDPDTGETSEGISIWNGTGGADPEGPHIYRHPNDDDYYYLMIAEGGTALNHSVTIARSENGIYGPYEPYEAGNPILTNRGTGSYFQTVGHADLFRDEVKGNWWGMALTTRSGPEYEVYPMGRESALFPVSWDEGGNDGWPVVEEQVGGRMRVEVGRLHEMGSRDDFPGTGGPWNSDPDVYDFDGGEEGNAAVPMNLGYLRVPPREAEITERKGLQVFPSRSNLTGDSGAEDDLALTGQRGIGFLKRTQTDTFFRYEVEMDFDPVEVDEEAGVAVFLTQQDHVNLGVVLLPSNATSADVKANTHNNRYFSFRTETTANGSTVELTPVPESWGSEPIRFGIHASNTTYTFTASLASSNGKKEVGEEEDSLEIGQASATVVSGGSGTFVGTVVGVYATCNGAGSGDSCPNDDIAFFKNWRYHGLGQQISATEVLH